MLPLENMPPLVYARSPPIVIQPKKSIIGIAAVILCSKITRFCSTPHTKWRYFHSFKHRNIPARKVILVPRTFYGSEPRPSSPPQQAAAAAAAVAVASSKYATTKQYAQIYGRVVLLAAKLLEKLSKKKDGTIRNLSYKQFAAAKK